MLWSYGILWNLQNSHKAATWLVLIVYHPTISSNNSSYLTALTSVEGLVIPLLSRRGRTDSATFVPRKLKDHNTHNTEESACIVVRHYLSYPWMPHHKHGQSLCAKTYKLYQQLSSPTPEIYCKLSMQLYDCTYSKVPCVPWHHRGLLVSAPRAGVSHQPLHQPVGWPGDHSKQRS